MKIRTIDYVGNLGGGLRFVVEILRAIQKVDPKIEIEFISQGQVYHRYLEVFKQAGLDLKTVEVKPSWSARLRQNFTGKWIPGKEYLKGLVTPIIQWHYEVSSDYVRDCDVLWLPWIHWHRLPFSESKNVVGSFHDAIVLQFQTDLAKARVENERETVRQWIRSEATIITSSNATVHSLADIYGAKSERFSVIPLSGEHIQSDNIAPAPIASPALPSEFVLYSANTFPHKNHETLLKALAKSDCIFPLVLSGEGTDLKNSDRGRILLELAESLGLHKNQCLYAMGYLPNEQYYFLLDNASALVMCSLAEGGGSFPVMEAMLRGKPVICSDIPVMREQLERTGGEVLWFSPEDYDELAEKLCYLHDHYDTLSRRAISQIASLKKRSWCKVAEEYLEIFSQVSQR